MTATTIIYIASKYWKMRIIIKVVNCIISNKLNNLLVNINISKTYYYESQSIVQVSQHELSGKLISCIYA